MNDSGRRVNSIIVKNLPTNYNQTQLEELFSKFGRVVSSKLLPSNPNFDGGCGFVNFAEPESCSKAVESMNNFSIDRFTLRVNHASPRTSNGFDRPINGSRESHDENHRTASPAIPNRFSGFRPATTARSPTTPNGFKTESDPSSNTPKPLWNSTNLEPRTNQEDTLTIREHDSFITKKTYAVYLSNLEVPNVVFAATLDDYVNATLLVTQMNKHEQLSKVQTNALKTKLLVGQWCAALFSGDWYRARVLEVEESRVRVQYIDWGNTGWCDSILEIRPLPNEFYKDPVLCVKCMLEGVTALEKLTDEQTNAILEILVLDVKLEMLVSRVENNLPYIQLKLGERNLNTEIQSILPVNQKATSALTFDSNKPELNLSEIHPVQLTTVDSEAECFHVLLMRDCLSTIMDVLKEWNSSRQPFSHPPHADMLVCGQYEGDGLWYRAWLKHLVDDKFRVYFVDFGNEEIVSIDRLSECPENLRTIPWQSVQIKLANLQLTDDERYLLLRDFETDRLEMKILSKQDDVYSVELSKNGKSLVEHMLELRKQKEVLKAAAAVVALETIPVEPKRVLEMSQPKSPPPPPATVPSNLSKPLTITNGLSKRESPNESDSSAHMFSEKLTAMITEQRRQNRLLEQVIAAVNTTNALLTQLVQR